MDINILFNYRETGGLPVMVEEKTVKIMVIRHNESLNLIACQVQGKGRVILYQGDETQEHLNDSEEQFVERITELLKNKP